MEEFLMAYVKSLVTYRVKGARGVYSNSLSIDPTVGVVGDRQFGLIEGKNVGDEWAPKAAFLVGMNTARMPSIDPFYNGYELSRNNVTKPHQAMLNLVKELLELPEPPKVFDTHGKFNLTDDKEPYVSFLNLATVRVLSEFMGIEIDPARFRMNVLLKGLSPFEELAWVNGYPGTRELVVGDVRFRIEDACERCKAIEASPESGTYDVNLREGLEKMMEAQGYAGSPHRNTRQVMGFLARPLTSGNITYRDDVSIQ